MNSMNLTVWIGAATLSSGSVTEEHVRLCAGRNNVQTGLCACDRRAGLGKVEQRRSDCFLILGS